MLNAQSERNDRFFDSFETLTDISSDSIAKLDNKEYLRRYTDNSKQCDSLILVGDTLTKEEVDTFLSNIDDDRQYVRLRKAKIDKCYVILVYYRSEANNEKGVDVYTYTITPLKSNRPFNQVCAVRCKLNENFSLWYAVDDNVAFISAETTLVKSKKVGDKEYRYRSNYCVIRSSDIRYVLISEKLVEFSKH